MRKSELTIERNKKCDKKKKQWNQIIMFLKKQEKIETMLHDVYSEFSFPLLCANETLQAP